jgi:hypothetical protein
MHVFKVSQNVPSLRLLVYDIEGKIIENNETCAHK